MNNFKYNPIIMTPFKWFVLENFPFIEEDFDSLTSYGLWCKLKEYFDKVATKTNVMGTQVENLTNAFIVLKDYVDNYFKNLDVEDEISNKLDEMVQDGTLKNILEPMFIKKSILTPIFASLWIVDNHSNEYIISTINKVKKAGLTGIVLLAHISNNNIRETIDALSFALNYAKSLNLICDTIKFHYTFGTLVEYSNVVNNVLQNLPEIKKIYVFNECNEFINNNLTDVYNFILNLKNRGYKVGMSTDSRGFQNLNSDENWQNIKNILDTIGFNYYPHISIPGTQANTSKSEKIWENINSFKQRFQDKKVVISETGVLPYMEFLENPSTYRISDYPTSTPTPNAQKIYFYGLLNKLNLNVVDGIYLWYTESFSDETWNFISQYTQGGAF